MKRLTPTLGAIGLALSLADQGWAQTGQVSVDPAGTVTIRDLAVPFSSYMSAEARQAVLNLAKQVPDPIWADPDAPIVRLRAADEDDIAPTVEKARARYAVTVVERTIAGIRVREITPGGGVARTKRKRVLINLHGGGFFTGTGGQALLESMPLSALGGYKVITVDYRQGPEHRFPAATDDVVAVYRELLRSHAARDIGIYGCSAGGSLATMATATLQQQGLPRPGAIGVLSASAFAGFIAPPHAPGAWGGDSRFTAPVLSGEPPQSLGDEPAPFPMAGTQYYAGTDIASPLASPGAYPDILARFPPTLVLTGTRAFDMSAAVQTHRSLLRAGATAQLNIWDGMGHCFFTDPDLPESREAFMVISQFFDTWLGKR